MSKLNLACYQDFVFSCKKWQKELGLICWKIEYLFANEEEDKHLQGNKAYVRMNREGMIATICLNKEWSIVEPTEFELDRCAFHEVCELLLRPLNVLTESRFNVAEEDVEYETHRIIRTLETLLVKER